MKEAADNDNPLLKQVSKLFEDLAVGQQERAPISPRITCTRLRRLREIRCELVEVSDPNLNSAIESDLEDTAAQLNASRNKNENLASWALRNKQVYLPLSGMQAPLGEQISNAKNGGKEYKERGTSNAFSNFSPAVLLKVAKNIHTPVSTLKLLATHYKAEVRKAVAANPHADEEIMTILAGDADENVRIALAENALLKRFLLLRLCDDASPLVSERAKNILYAQAKPATKDNLKQKSVENLVNDETPISLKSENENRGNENRGNESKGNESKEQSRLIENEFLQVIAERATTPPRRLAELARHSDKLIRSLVAANPNATPEILWQLAKDNCLEVRKKLLSNYNCPEDIIDYLLRK